MFIILLKIAIGWICLSVVTLIGFYFLTYYNDRTERRNAE